MTIIISKSFQNRGDWGVEVDEDSAVLAAVAISRTRARVVCELSRDTRCGIPWAYSRHNRLRGFGVASRARRFFTGGSGRGEERENTFPIRPAHFRP